MGWKLLAFALVMAFLGALGSPAEGGASGMWLAATVVFLVTYFGSQAAAAAYRRFVLEGS